MLKILSLFLLPLLLFADGDLDTSFGEGMIFTDLSNDDDYAYDAIIDSQGRIIVTGLSRITSYNVCYTKLLRVRRWRVHDRQR